MKLKKEDAVRWDAALARLEDVEGRLALMGERLHKLGIFIPGFGGAGGHGGAGGAGGRGAGNGEPGKPGKPGEPGEPGEQGSFEEEN